MIQFDCHAHVYENTDYYPGSRYKPTSPAPLATWLKHQTDHGIKGGVIVQVSFLGTDNTQLCAALSQLDLTRFAGVAVVPLDVDDNTLGELVAKGVRGVRWNLVRGKNIPDLTSAQVKAFLARLQSHDLHLEVHLESARLAPLLPALHATGITVVIDHFGLPNAECLTDDPLISGLSNLAENANTYVKLSAPYRSAIQLKPYAQWFLEHIGPDHLVWGSDWPHTQYDEYTNYAQAFLDLQDWGTWDDCVAVENLYGLSVNHIN